MKWKSNRYQHRAKQAAPSGPTLESARATSLWPVEPIVCVYVSVVFVLSLFLFRARKRHKSNDEKITRKEKKKEKNWVGRRDEHARESENRCGYQEN